MRPWPLLLAACLLLPAQPLPSSLAISQEEADQAIRETGKTAASSGAGSLVGVRQKELERLSQLGQKQAKTLFGVQGAHKGAQVEAIKADLAKRASWMKRWTRATGILDYGDAIGEAGGYLTEGDARGAFGVLADTAGKKLSGIVGGAVGALGGPLTALAGKSAGEGSWEVNPLKKKISDFVDASRIRSYADEYLGYRPTWRDKEAAEAKKRRDAERAQTPPTQEAQDQEASLRKQVEGRLISQNLPATEALVSQLVGLIQSRGQDALDAALRECSAMQGSFQGTLGGQGNLELQVQGLSVNATFADRQEAHGRGIVAVAVTTGEFTGTFDPVSGNVQFTGILKIFPIAKGITPEPEKIPVRFTGHFTGQGYTGNAVANEQARPWTVSR